MSRMAVISFLAMACANAFSAQMASQQWVMNRIEEATNNISGASGYATIEEVNAKISTNNAAFVSAVLAVPLAGADAGDLAEIAEYGGYGTVGAALLALIAGLAALKRRVTSAETALAQKASLSDLPYRLVEPGVWKFSDGEDYALNLNDYGDFWAYELDYSYISVQRFESESSAKLALSLTFEGLDVTATRASLPGHLLDRAVNAVSVTGETTITLPDKIDGKSRDFYLRMEVTESQDVSFSPSSGVEYAGYGNPAKAYSNGTYVLHFRETAWNEFCVMDMLERPPTKTSDLTNDSGFITASQVPTPDKIQDISGNVINADRSVSVDVVTYYWRVYDGNENGYDFTGTKTNSEWTNGTDKMTLVMPDSSHWTLQRYFNLAGAWISQWSETIEGTEEDNSIVFHEQGYSGSWIGTHAQTSDELVVKSVFDATVGNINTILDTINGEEI